MKNRIPNNIINLKITDNFNYDYVDLELLSFDRYNLSYYYQLFDVNGSLIRKLFLNLDGENFNNGTTLVTHLIHIIQIILLGLEDIIGWLFSSRKLFNKFTFKTGPYYPPSTHSYSRTSFIY